MQQPGRTLNMTDPTATPAGKATLSALRHALAQEGPWNT
jgi:hypothetical protein